MKVNLDKADTRKREDRIEEQNRRLSEMVHEGYRVSRRFKEELEMLGLLPSDIRTIEDLQKLPIISREDLVKMEEDDPPYGGFSPKEIIPGRIFISPGPVYEPHLSEGTLWARGYRAAGFSSSDTVINTFSYHMVAAGLTFHEGLRACGATVIPSGPSGTETQVKLIRDLGVTAFTGTPSFLRAIIEKAEDMGCDFRKDLKLKKASFVAEPLPKQLRQLFEEKYGIDTYQMYGATEVGDIAYECSEKSGWHLCDDVIVEIVDPQTGERKNSGMLGEVVVTRLNSMFFLFRFGTGDLSSISESICPCGRTSVTLSGIAGRIGEAVKVRGMFVAPSQVREFKNSLNVESLQVVIKSDGQKDHVSLHIAGSEKLDEGTLSRLKEHFKKVCGVRADNIASIRESEIEGAKLILDKRSWTE